MKIEIKGYSKILSKHLVLSEINMEMESGKIYGFTGKNGSGKTMMMRAICGLILPTSGYVKIDGKEIGKDISFPPDVGALIENPGFVPGDTGFCNLKNLARIQNKIDDEEIRNWIACVGLDSYDKKSYRKYSLGMKQKLGIAAAMMEHPALLILDEPFNALDEESVTRIRALIWEMKKSGALIIIACHNAEEMDALCDVVYKFHDGKLVLMGKDAEKNDV